MNPQEELNQPPTTKVANNLTAMQPNERMICSIKRHPIGIIGVYIMGGLLLIIGAILAFVIAPSASTNSNSAATEVGAVVFLIGTILVLAFLLISTKVYWGNEWTITSDSVTQVNQTSLFNRQSSQLSLGNLEDVTAEQNGIFSHVFNYGLLKVETAGERSKFSFAYCPNPNYYAREILMAREQFEQGVHANQGNTTPYSPDQSPGVNNNTNTT